MKKLTTFLVLSVAACLQLQAQHPEGNPFARLGYKTDVYTFGDKKEFHDQEEIVEIGDVLFNTRTNEVVGFVEDAADSLIKLKPELQSMSIDPHCEKYYSVSPYTYCMNNPVNCIDPDGRDWYRNNETLYYTWYEGDQERDGFTYMGNKGSVLGEFESIIDNVLTQGFNTESMYSEGFTFDIVNNDKGALIGSKERGWDFLDEFANGTGPEFSVFLSDHPYTQAMKSDDAVVDAQQAIAEKSTNIPGQVTGWSANWEVWDALTTPSMAKQFIGSYRFDAFTSKNGKSLNNVISDSKSMSSFLYHLYPGSKNPRRSTQKPMGATYQFYIWQTLKK